MAALGRWTTTDPILGEQSPAQLLKDGKVQAFSMSAYNYSFNNPVNLRDKTGKWPTPWDIADVGFAALSIRDAWNDPSASNIGWAVADVAAAALPFVPSTGAVRAVRAVAKADDAVDAVRGAKAVNRGSDAASGGKKGVVEIQQHGKDHLSVTTHADKSVQTELGQALDGSAHVKRANKPGDRSVFVEVPDIDAAQSAQRSMIGPAGQYDFMRNSCATHCADVANAGGVDLPTTTTQIIRWLKNQKAH
jgi:hypothetical protein